MSILDSIFGTRSGKDAANQYLNQIPGVAHEGYDPYINAGRDASGKTKSAYESMMDDPTGFINKLMEQYKESEGYQYQKGQLTNEMSNTSAAGGIAGTPFDQQQQAGAVQGLLSKDMQQFLQNVLGVHSEGLKGEEGIAERGYGASGKLTDALGGALNQQGGMAFNDVQQKNKRTQDLWKIFANALGAGGGFAFGGPAGAAAGAGLASNIFG